MILSNVIALGIIIINLNTPLDTNQVGIIRDTVNDYYVEADMYVNEGIHHYILVDETYEDNDVNYPDASILSRSYLEVFNQEFDISSYGSTVFMDKVRSVNTAREYVDSKELDFKNENVVVTISPYVTFKWIFDGYVPKH